MTIISDSLPTSLPLLVLEQLDLTDDDLNKVLNYKVDFGNKKEIDILKLSLEDYNLAFNISNYWISNCNLWNSDKLISNNTTTKKVLRRIYKNKMIDTKIARTDLRNEINLLKQIPEVGNLLKSVLDVNPDFEKLSKDYKSLNFTILEKSDKNSTISFRIKNKGTWPDLLGGASSPAEIEREFKLKISYAPWRDRRNRRLLSIDIYSVEIWIK